MNYEFHWLQKQVEHFFQLNKNYLLGDLGFDVLSLHILLDARCGGIGLGHPTNHQSYLVILRRLPEVSANRRDVEQVEGCSGGPSPSGEVKNLQLCPRAPLPVGAGVTGPGQGVQPWQGRTPAWLDTGALPHAPPVLPHQPLQAAFTATICQGPPRSDAHHQRQLANVNSWLKSGCQNRIGLEKTMIN